MKSQRERSVVALIDALGFQNIWRRYPYEETSQALTTVRRTLAGIAEWAEKHIPLGVALKLGCFSDTMYLFAHPENVTPDPSWPQKSDHVRSCISLMAMCVGYAVREAAIQVVPTTYRGVITVGEAFVGPDNIFLGPAVAEAAECYENAQALLSGLAIQPSEWALAEGTIDLALGLW
jgi:hypothetical protein